MKNILWLCSWYPNDEDPSAANFIRRQAQALALYERVYVLYIHPVFDKAAPYVQDHITSENGLTEHIVYYRSPIINGWYNKYISLKRYMKQADRCFKQYVELYGHPDYVHVHVPIRAGLFAHRLLRKKKIPYALTEHYGIYNNEVEDPFLKRSQVYISSVRRIVRDAKPLIVVSQSLADDMNREVMKRDSRVIPNVVNKKFFNYSPNTNTSFIQFLHVSNMIPLKNVKGIIDAFVIVHKMLPHTKLFLIGRTNDNILEHAEKSGLKSDSLIFTGELPYEKVAEYMHQSHALVMFSNTESMSCVVAEALCCGLPVISTSTGIARDIINESNGLLVEKRNIKQLADAMYRVATGLYKYDRKMISSKAVAMFSYEVVGKQISDCYK